MTKILKDFRLRVHDLGTTTPGAGTVDFTLEALASYPDYGQQIIHPARSQTETSPWRFEVVDVDEALTDHLANASTGRMHLLGRLLEVQENTNGAGFATVCIGRISDVTLATNPANYVIEVSDERWVERRAVAFSEANTCQLWPPGLRYRWRAFGGFSLLDIASDAEGILVESSGSARKIRLYSQWPISPEIVQWIRQDVVDDPNPGRTDGEGNFEHLRLDIGGTDYPILTFGEVDGTDVLAGLDLLPQSPGLSIELWIWASSLAGTFSASFWAPTAPPSPTLPLHIGVADDSHEWGYPNPFEFIQTLYDALGVRYDSAVFADLISIHEWNHIQRRLTSEVTDVASFLDDFYYGPLGYVAFINSSGEVAPRLVRLPEALDPDTLFEFNGSNLREAPTWEHLGRDIVNVVVSKYDFHKQVVLEGGVLGGKYGTSNYPSRDDWPADLLVPEERTIRTEYDNLDNLGTHAVEWDLKGFAPGGEGTIVIWPDATDVVTAMHNWHAREAFERWGDGAQKGTMKSLRAVADGSGRTPSDVENGDFVKINVDTYPNAVDNDRGGTRIVQILSRKPTALGIDFEFADVGPSLQPPADPTVAIAQNASNPHHAVDVTISDVPSGATVEIELSVGASNEWSRRVEGLEAGVVTVGRFPAGTTIYVRGRSCIPNRSRSDWSSSDSVATASLTAPSGLSVDDEIGDRALATWTNGESGYQIEILLGSTSVAILPPGTTAYEFRNLSTSTGYTAYVRHIDAYGGTSASDSDAFTTTATPFQLTAPYSVTILVGGDQV